MVSSELHTLLNPRLWVHKGVLPVTRRFRNPELKNKRKREFALKNRMNIGVVLEAVPDLVWVGVTPQDTHPGKGLPIHYDSPEKLLSYWELAQ